MESGSALVAPSIRRLRSLISKVPAAMCCCSFTSLPGRSIGRAIVLFEHDLPRRGGGCRQPATIVLLPLPLRIAPIEPGSAIENTMIGNDVSRASAKAVASITL